MRESNISTKSGRETVVFIELLRVIACFFVIVNHTNSRIFQNGSPSVLWFISVFYFFMSKVAVPIFIMITGYTILDREDSYRKMLARFLRIAASLLLFSGLYYIYGYIEGEISRISIKSFIGMIIREPVRHSLWYLYLYLALVLMMPFLQKMVKNMNRIDFHVFFAISSLFCGIWPLVIHYIPALTYTHNFSLPVFNSYICMLLWGCYFKRFCRWSRREVALCAVVFLAICALNTGLTYCEYLKSHGGDYLLLDNRESFPIIAASACVFGVVSTLKFNDKMNNVVTKLGKMTFGIYLVSDFFVLQFEPLYKSLVERGLYPMVAMLIFEMLVFLAGVGTIYLMKKIPLLKEII